MCSLQLNELVVGDTSGKLLVYKNDDSKPWITRTCVGMVGETGSLLGGHNAVERLWFFNPVCIFQLTCVAIGDVCNKGKVGEMGKKLQT